MPYLGFFDRLLHTDHFLILDDVQFIRRGWQHRDIIKSREDTPWLTLSLKKGEYHQKILDVKLSEEVGWIKSNLNLISECYSKAPYFDLVFSQVESIYHAGHKRMIDINMALLRMALNLFEIDVTISFSSEYFITSTSTQRLVDLVSAVNGDIYLTGPGSKNYLDEYLFDLAGIRVRWQNFKHPVYPQLHGNFVPMLSCLDVLFNCGPDAAKILRSAA